MCGIVGFASLQDGKADEGLLVRMAEAVAHRGPDDAGVWTGGSVGLGHRRLSIIDLSEAGHQPMFNESGDVVITYNGELYNYLELREQLKASGHRFRSQTDTEVIIHAYEEWGTDCLARFNGHFAFAIWDSTARHLFLARDRFGVKPLYYAWQNGCLVFASEIKSILLHPSISRSVSTEALNEYFTFQNILSDKTLFEGIHLLQPGSFLSLVVGEQSQPQVTKYWDYQIREEPLKADPAEAEEELYRLFDQAVTRQLMSDVPLGCYLSGGIDSGSITAVARKQTDRLMTFTMGFDLSSASGLELSFDERANSEVLATLLRTEHYEMLLQAGDMEHIMPELTLHLEDLRVGQCYMNYYVARLTGKFVKVVLSGIGGDELFGGYPWRYMHGIHAATEEDYYRQYYGFWQRLVPDARKRSLLRPGVYSKANAGGPFESFRSLIKDSGLSIDSPEGRINASLYFELRTFLHGLLLMEDKVSMAHSLETRVPFLDNDLVDFALNLPVHHKLKDLDKLTSAIRDDDINRREKFQIQSTHGKVLLRQAMTRLIPESVTSRIKQGFSAPDASWFRGQSIDYVDGLLRSDKAEIYEYLEPAFVATVLDEHEAGKVNHRLLIWSLLSFEWWLRTFMVGR
jgi:asparagine synthase (glutamine-hydrolysing)